MSNDLVFLMPGIAVLMMAIFCFWFRFIRKQSATEIERLMREKNEGLQPPATLL